MYRTLPCGVINASMTKDLISYISLYNVSGVILNVLFPPHLLPTDKWSVISKQVGHQYLHISQSTLTHLIRYIRFTSRSSASENKCITVYRYIRFTSCTNSSLNI